MVAHCAICKQKYIKKSNVGNGDERLSFHGFPRDPTERTSWVTNIRKIIPDFEIPVEGIVCSRHFNKDDFYIPGLNRTTHQLKEHAVPTVFPLLKFTPKVAAVTSQPRPILPKPTLVSLDNSVDIKDVFIPKQKKLEIGDKVFCRVGDKLVPGLVENVKSVNMSDTTQPEFVDVHHYGDDLEQVTVKSEVASDTEEPNNFEPQEDEVTVENEVFSYSEFHLDGNDIPEYDIASTVRPKYSLLDPDYMYSRSKFSKFDIKRTEQPVWVPEKYRIPLTESKMKDVEKNSHCNDRSNSPCNDRSNSPDCVIKRAEVTLPRKCLESTKEEHSQSFDLDMSEIPEYESVPSGKRKIHQLSVIAGPKIKVVKYSQCNSSPQIRSLTKHSDNKVEIQNTQIKPLEPVVQTHTTSKPSVDKVQSASTPFVVPATSAPSNVIYSIIPAAANNLIASQPLTSVQSKSVPPPTCPAFIMLTPPTVRSQNSAPLKLNITSDQLLASAGNAPFLFLKPPIMSSQVSSTASTNATQSAAPVFATSSFFPQSAPGVTAAIIQSILPQLGIPTSDPSKTTSSYTQSLTSISSVSTTSSTQSLTTTPSVATTPSLFSHPTMGETIQSLLPQLSTLTSPVTEKVSNSTNTPTTSSTEKVSTSSNSTQSPSNNKQNLAKSSVGDKSNASELQNIADDDNSLPLEAVESISECNNEGINIEDDDSTVVTDKTTAAILRNLRKILRERKLSMRAMSDRLKRREKRIKVLTEKVAKFTTLSKPTPEHHAAEILSKKFPTCIQHFMSKIASISDPTDKKAFKYSQELKDFLVNLRFSNDPYSYLNSMLKNGLPSDEVLTEWANSSGFTVNN